MKAKTARRFLDRNKWKIKSKEGNASFFRRINQCKVSLGADPVKLVDYSTVSIWQRLMRAFN